MRPDLLILLVVTSIFVYVWRIQDLYPILAAVQLPILTSLAAIALFLFDADKRRSIRGLRHPITTVLGVIVFMAVISVPTSVYPGLSFRFVVGDFGKNVALFVVLAAGVRSFADVKRYAAAIVIGGVVYGYYVYSEVSLGLGGRPDSMAYYDANDVAMLMVASMPLAIYFILRAKSVFARIGAALAFLLFVIVMIKCGSRGALLAIIAVALYMLFLFRAVAPGTRSIAVAAGCAILLIGGGDNYWEMMRTMLNPKADYNWSGNSETGRMDVWKRGMGYMFSNPITGVGVAAFPVAEGTVSEMASRQDYGFGLKWSAAHNSFVQIGAELGVVGLVGFVALLVCAYRGARANRPPPGARTSTDEQVLGQALAGSVVAFGVAGFFLSQAYCAFIFTLIGTIVGLAKVAPQTPNPATRPSKRGTRPAAIGSRGGAMRSEPVEWRRAY